MQTEFQECVIIVYLSKIEEFIEEIFSPFPKGAHALDHSRRVYSIAEKIGAELGADMKILLSAALLHDIGRVREKSTGVSHSILSGEMSSEFLRSIDFTEEETKKVKETIRTHRFSEGLSPTSLEGQILSDADKLDAIGAIGIYRTIAHAVETGVGLEGFLKHAQEKLLRLHNLMYTDIAKKMAKNRHNILDLFVKEIHSELEI
ncbi:MAG: HD domain-containing protein [Candidatus Lokiarchaeota archaeon]|nr:HD domain-containing protein [Candidatus Lokiarchaeota archaeon]